MQCFELVTTSPLFILLLFITVCLIHRIKTNYIQEYPLVVWL